MKSKRNNLSIGVRRAIGLSLSLCRIALALVAIISAEPVFGGVLISPGVHSKAFSFRPNGDEATPNYFGYGGSLRLGYSVAQVLDLALFYSYTPGRTDSAWNPANGDALHRFGGIALGLRIAKSVFVEGRVGRLDYSLLTHSNPNEIGGHYTGLGAGGSVGGIIPVNASHFWQITLDADVGSKMHMLGETGEDTRSIDAVSLSLAYVFNHFFNSNIDNSSVGAFLNSLHSF